MLSLTGLTGLTATACSPGRISQRTSAAAGPGAVASTAAASAGPSDDVAALRRLVLDTATALRRGGAGLAAVPADAVVRAGLTATSASMAAMRVEGLDLAVDPTTVRRANGTVAASAVGRATVAGVWPDGAPLLVPVAATRVGGRWVLTRFGAAGAGDAQASGPATTSAAALAQPWDLAGLRRVDGDGVVVVGDAPPERLRWYADATARAWRADRSVWSRRPAGLPVVVVPRSSAGFAAQVRRPVADVAQVAAMTVGSLERGRTALGDRVVVNPVIDERLTPAGRRTILRHELVHLAIRGTTTAPAPQWLVEGYATQASWDQPAGAVPDQVAARARAWDAAQRSPSAPPTDAQVEGRDVTYTYDASAILVADMVARRGRAAAQALYEQVVAGQGLDPAARSALGEPWSATLAAWRAAMARASSGRL